MLAVIVRTFRTVESTDAESIIVENRFIVLVLTAGAALARQHADVVERDYATQRIVYALAALRDGAPRAEVAYCFLERPGEPVTRAFTAADAGALTEHLAGLARGLIEGRYPVAEVPHRELCGDCPGRAAMCSWGESETLRELPANVNGGH